MEGGWVAFGAGAVIHLRVSAISRYGEYNGYNKEESVR
jgi:hypothetical protein